MVNLSLSLSLSPSLCHTHTYTSPTDDIRLTTVYPHCSTTYPEQQHSCTPHEWGLQWRYTLVCIGCL